MFAKNVLMDWFAEEVGVELAVPVPGVGQVIVVPATETCRSGELVNSCQIP